MVVVTSTPGTIVIRHDGGLTTLRREELTPPLSVTYPVHANADEAEEKDRKERAARIQSETRNRIHANLLLQEQRIQSTLHAAKTQLRRLNEVLIVQINAAKGAGKHSIERQTASHSRQHKVSLIQQIHTLEDQLAATRNQISSHK